VKGNDICQKRGVTCEHKYVSFAQRKQMEHYSLLFDTLLLLLLLLLFITIILIYIYICYYLFFWLCHVNMCNLKSCCWKVWPFDQKWAWLCGFVCSNSDWLCNSKQLILSKKSDMSAHTISCVHVISCCFMLFHVISFPLCPLCICFGDSSVSAMLFV
jgi:hypothetical protein